MFESAELGHETDKQTYDRAVPKLREELLDLQQALRETAAFPLIVIVGGVDGAGKGETVNLLNEWMDPRYIQTHAFGEPSDEERERPAIWRFWRALPPKGRIGVFFGAWHTAPIVDRVLGRSKRAAYERSLEEILHFEQMLADEGALIVKFWFHLSRRRQKQRLTALSKDPKSSWRVTPLDWQRFEIYDDFRKVSEHALRETSTAHAPWIVVEGLDARYRSLTVGRILRDALKRRLPGPGKGKGKERRPDAPTRAAAPPLIRSDDDVNVLRALDLGRSVPKREYQEKLETLQARLNRLARAKRFKKRGAVLVFEGPDAAGKGGAIRRVTSALDARFYDVIAVAAPSEEERAQPYLWRFWRHVPRRGRFSLFDRSWYGRVLVERIEGFCREADWMRAYSEINDFERHLCEHGLVVVKFWLAISKAEQLRRFKEREATGFNASRSRGRTGATARSGRTTRRRCATWWTAPAATWPPGSSSRPTTSTTRASRCSAACANGSRPDRGYFLRSRMCSSTRRLAERPSSVALSPIGLSSPKPLETRRPAAMPWPTR